MQSIAPRLAPGNETGRGVKAQAMDRFLQAQINRLWMRRPEERKSYLEPPFQVFINKNFHDSERMNFINQHSPLPAGTVVRAENFLRLNDSAVNETFSVSINSLGFRGLNRTKEKPAKTFRIIVLGSYPAFGHGVNDNETYPFILEQELNEKFKGRVSFEVWNGGRQGGTSIMGYARLIHEVSSYKPDLIIWDYGWIELYLARDRVPFKNSVLRIKKYSDLENHFFHVCIKTALSHLKLCQVAVQKMTKISYSEAIAGWQESMSLVTEWSKRNKMAFIFLHHSGVTIPKEEYKKFDRPSEKFHFVDTSPALTPAPLGEEIDDFWSKKNWLSELGEDKAEIMRQDPGLIFFGDAIQYNKHAYRRIGRYLATIILEKEPNLLKQIP